MKNVSYVVDVTMPSLYNVNNLVKIINF